MRRSPDVSSVGASGEARLPGGAARGLRVLYTVGWTIAVLLLPAFAGGAPLRAGAGYDYSVGNNETWSRRALGYAVIPFASTEWTLLVARRALSNDERRTDGVVALSAPVRGNVFLRAEASRTIGDHSFRAWSCVVGPTLHILESGRVGLFVARVGDNRSGRLDGVGADFAVAVSPRLTAEVAASTWSGDAGPHRSQARAGMAVRPVGRVPIQLLGQFTVGRNGIVATQSSGSSGGALDALPILGSGSEEGSGAPATTSLETVSLLSLGVRVLVP